MGSQNDKVSPEFDAFIGVGRRWRWLFDWLTGCPTRGRYAIQSVSFRRGPILQSVVVKALDADEIQNVIVFGQGESFYKALSNATAAIGKGQWKPDKYMPSKLS